jgi:hypothetical protein
MLKCKFSNFWWGLRWPTCSGGPLARELRYTDKSKYSGKNDNFNFKLTIFTDLC